MRSEPGGELPALSAETLSIDKRSAVRGRIKLRTDRDLYRDQITERRDQYAPRSRGREVDAAPSVWTEGDTTIIPVVAWVLVVEKRLVLRDEIHIQRRSKTESIEIPAALHRQNAVLERMDLETREVAREELEPKRW